QVLLDQEVPVATAADLDHVDLELRYGGRQPPQLAHRPGLAGRGTQRVAVDVVHEPEVLPAADGAPHVDHLAVVLGGVLQVRRGVTDLEEGDPPGVHVAQQGSPLERVVDHPTPRTHGMKGTQTPQLAPGHRPDYSPDVSDRYIRQLHDEGRRSGV